MREAEESPAASGSSGDRPLRPWQFSLRSLMILTGGLGLFLGIRQLRAAEPVIQVCSLLILFFQFYVLVLLAAGGRFPRRWTLARGMGASLVAGCVLVLWGEHWQSRFHSMFVVFLSASWLCWPSLAALIWFVRRVSTPEDRQTQRRVSVIHLLVETSCLMLVFLAAWLQGMAIEWYQGDRLWILAFLANSVPLLLWLSLFSPWRNIVKRGWPDSLFRWSMIVALGIAATSCLAMLYLSQNRDRLDEYYSSRGEYTLFWYEIATAIVFRLPQLVSSALFAISATCQLFRAHQDRWLIALACVYFVPFWLVLLAVPRVFP